ncbi:MAG TPA: methyltransferase domain-containing protein, partial [Rhodothermales bacterium]|nr:methyltransferase domain-containing protein [Rhodothermales bacterium]
MTDNTLQTLTDDEIRQTRWYYQVELRPGVYTDGPEQHTAAMVRSLAERIDLAGTQCLDLGTQEGLMAVSLARLGAETVVAYDRLDLSDRIAMVKEAYEVDFDYQHGLYLHELSAALQTAGYDPFDVVVFAGVLYHMIDPLAGLGTARSFVRENGLL